METVAAAVGGATFYVGTAIVAAGTGVIGISLGNMALSGAVSGALSGQASKATENLLNGEAVTDGLGDPKDLLVDAAVGGTLAFLGGLQIRRLPALAFPAHTPAISAKENYRPLNKPACFGADGRGRHTLLPTTTPLSLSPLNA